MIIPYSPVITPLCGPLAINVYGTCIALALLLCMKLIPLNKRYSQLNLEPYFVSIIMVCIISAVIGGRLLAIVSEPTLYHHWYEWFMIWNGGFSALGSILGVTFGACMYLKKVNLPVLPVFDLMAIYAPLFQSVARLGCLFAGCCYGKQTHSFLHVMYTNKNAIAPHNIALHPTQLYSSVLLFLIFLCMYFIIQKRARYSGQLFLTYFMLASAERFVVDFWRADRIIMKNYFLSFHQIIALIILFFSVVIMFILSKQKKTRS